MKFFQHAGNIACTTCADLCRTRLHPFDVITLLVHECGMCGAAINSSTITDGNVWKECFAAQNFCKARPVEYSYGAIVYEEENNKSAAGVFGEDIMAVSQQKFHTWGIAPLQKSKCFEVKFNTIRLVPGRFSTMQHINDLHRVPGSNFHDVDDIVAPRTANGILEKRLYRRETL